MSKSQQFVCDGFPSRNTDMRNTHICLSKINMSETFKSGPATHQG